MYLFKTAFAVAAVLAFTLMPPAQAAHGTKHSVTHKHVQRATKVTTAHTKRIVVAAQRKRIIIATQQKPIIIAAAPVAVAPLPSAALATPTAAPPLAPAPARSSAFRTCGVERDNVENLYGANDEGDYAQVIDFGR